MNTQYLVNMKAIGVVVMTQSTITGKACNAVLNGGHAVYNIPFYAKYPA